MPADIITVRVCRTVLEFQTTVNDYVQAYDYQTGWHCGCAGFRYRRTCRHVEEAKKLRCCRGEGAMWGSSEPEWPDDGKCPDCGGETSGLRIAV